MKARVKDKIKELGLVNFGANRKQGKTLNLCTCSNPKRQHYNNALGHTYRGGDEKNVVPQGDQRSS